MGIETLVASTIASFFTSLGLGTTAAGIAAAVTVTAALLGASYLLARMQKKPKASEQQQTIKQAIAERQRTYGRDKVGGAVVFYETRGGNLYTAVVHGEGPISGFVENWLNDVQGPADMSAGSGISPWGGNVVVTNFHGYAGQIASWVLTAAFPGVWTADHRLAGLAYSVVECRHVKAKFFQAVYPNGAPQHRPVIDGALLFDPRDGGTRYSDNPALCIRDYLTYSRGLKVPPSLIDDASFAAFANVCDQPVALAAGGAEPRYRLSLTYKLTREPREVSADLLRSCDAEFYQTTDGKVGIRGGVWTAPTETLTAEDVLDYTFRTGSGVNAEFNRLNMTFKDPSNDYQPVEISPWNDTAAQAVVGVLHRELDLQMVTSFSQARRLGKIFMAQSNPAFRLVLTIRYSAALRLWGERMVSVTIPELLLDAQPFMIAAASLSPAAMNGRVELVHLPASAYAWSTAEEGARPTIAPSTAVAAAAPGPTGAVATVEWSVVSGGIRAGRIAVTVTPLTGVATTYRTIGQYRLVGASEWTDMTDDGDWRVLSGIVADAATYNVRVAHAISGGAASPSLSAWVDLADLAVIADPNAPATASQGGFSTSVSGGSVTVSWVLPNIAGVAEGRVYRAATSSFGAASLVATIWGAPSLSVQATDSPGSGTHYYFIRAVNGSGVGSAPEGPQSVLV